MGLIREAEWTSGGHRLYDETVFEKLSRILELRKSKTLFEIRKILSSASSKDYASREGRLTAAASREQRVNVERKRN
jgi:DNA-binding transcriptional MerR regulator